MTKTNIEWTEESWNPIVGCSILSPGCTHCYAMAMAARIEAGNAALVAADKKPLAPQYDGTTRLVNGHAVWTGRLGLAEKTLLAPLKRKKPTLYFVNSMGDLFHENCPDEHIDRVFAVMALTPQHTYQVLTKRAERMRNYFAETERSARTEISEQVLCLLDQGLGNGRAPAKFPLPNVWLGVSTERQQEADERIPHLLATPAAVRFISAEPLLGPIDLENLPSVSGIGRYLDALSTAGAEFSDLPGRLDWVIAGGESGPGARPMHPDWARSLRDQCAAADVPFFFKQWGAWSPTHPDYPNAIPSAVANDGTVYFSPDLAYPDGKRYGEALRAGHERAHLTSMYNIGKARAGKLLDGRTHQAMPAIHSGDHALRPARAAAR